MNKLKSLFSIFLTVTVLVLSSCQPDEDENGNPTPTPTPTDARDKFVAAWSCAENSSQNGSSTFEVHINKDPNNSSRVFIENFNNFGFQNKAYATVSASTLTLPDQTVSAHQVKGNGTLTSSGKISMFYTIDDGSGSAVDSVTATLTKK